jgi:hypothetical protein
MGETGNGGQAATRDAAWIDREYGRDKWPAVRRKIDATIATGERSLSRILAILARWEWGCPGLESAPAIALGAPVRLPASLAWHGFYAAVAEAVISACCEDTRIVADLGCGWGRSLFDVWLRGGPREATYHALEFTQAGLDCVAMLAALEPGMPVRAARFDFQNPDFSSLPQGLEHAVVFTVSSVHQVPMIEKNALRAIARIAEKVDCLHFEQIGWQIAPRTQTNADREYALRNHYNQNLWDVLTRLRDDREIALVKVDADLFGMQAVYPMSLVHWRRSQV